MHNFFHTTGIERSLFVSLYCDAMKIRLQLK